MNQLPYISFNLLEVEDKLKNKTKQFFKNI